MEGAVRPSSLVGMELPELRMALGPEHPAFRARQLFDALYRRQVADLSEISTLPQALRNQLVSRFTPGLPAIEKRYDSVDGTRRYLLRLATIGRSKGADAPEDAGTPSAFRARLAALSIASSASRRLWAWSAISPRAKS